MKWIAARGIVRIGGRREANRDFEWFRIWREIWTDGVPVSVDAKSLSMELTRLQNANTAEALAVWACGVAAPRPARAWPNALAASMDVSSATVKTNLKFLIVGLSLLVGAKSHWLRGGPVSRLSAVPQRYPSQAPVARDQRCAGWRISQLAAPPLT